MERLNIGVKGALTLISAPAGFGKTTLVSEWYAAQPNGKIPVGWLSLDTDDNDPLRFVTYLAASLQSLSPDILEDTLALLQSPQAPRPQAVLTCLINDLSTCDRPFALVLDDYHTITAQPVHDALIYLLNHLPPAMRLVILTRADPPLPLARFRARGQLTEIRAADLRFTPDEAACFLNDLMGLDLSENEISALESRTEGWIAGLQLAALSMQGRDDIDGFIAAFTGSHQYIMDYLLDEVFNTQPEEVKTFLLHTSILDRLCGPLCDAILEQTGNQAMLERLQSANLFLIPLDDSRYWYRYHHLFADVLRNRLCHTAPNRAAELQSRASRWFAENNLLEEAITYALAAPDYEQAAVLMECAIEELAAQSRTEGVIAWVDALPAEVVNAHPRLGLRQVWALYFAAQVSRAEVRLHEVEQTLSDIDRERYAGEIALWSGAMAYWHDDQETSLPYFHQALEQLPAEPTDMRTRTLTLQGLAYHQSDPCRAEQSFRQALALAETAGNTNGQLSVREYLANVHFLQGRLHDMATGARTALSLAAASPYLSNVNTAYVMTGKLCYERNELNEAARHLEHALELTDGLGNVDYDIPLFLANAYYARGETASAQPLYNRAETIARRRKVYAQVEVLETRVRLLLQKGWLDQAVRLVGAWNSPPANLPLLPHAYLQMARARVAIGQGQAERSVALLSDLLNPLEEACMGRLVIECHLLLAQAWQQQDQVEQALDSLAAALALAESEGFVRTFVDEGAPMEILLRRAGSQGIAPQYVARLLAAFDRVPVDSTGTRQPLIEPLSERELEVLCLLAEGCSNQQIADTLVLAVGTVKKHLNNIYGKLNITSRTQCIARARDLGLLDF